LTFDLITGLNPNDLTNSNIILIHQKLYITKLKSYETLPLADSIFNQFNNKVSRDKFAVIKHLASGKPLKDFPDDSLNL
jgi:hypothetical protein